MLRIAGQRLRAERRSCVVASASARAFSCEVRVVQVLMNRERGGKWVLIRVHSSVECWLREANVVLHHTRQNTKS